MVRKNLRTSCQFLDTQTLYIIQNILLKNVSRVPNSNSQQSTVNGTFVQPKLLKVKVSITEGRGLKKRYLPPPATEGCLDIFLLSGRCF